MTFLTEILVPILTAFIGTVAGALLILKREEKKLKQGEIKVWVQDRIYRAENTTWIDFRLDLYNSYPIAKIMRQITIRFSNQISYPFKSEIELSPGNHLKSITLIPFQIMTKNCRIEFTGDSLQDLDIVLFYNDENDKEHEEIIQRREK